MIRFARQFMLLCVFGGGGDGVTVALDDDNSLTAEKKSG